MADLDNKEVMGLGNDYGIVKQAGASAELVWSRALTQGEQHSFVFLIKSADNTGAASASAAISQALFLVDALWDATASEWQVNTNAVGVQGSATVTWAASMSGDTLQLTADGDTDWLHMAMLLGGTKCEFAVAISGA